SEEDLGERRIAGEDLDRTDLDSRRLHVDQKEADSVLLAGGIRADEAEAPVGVETPGCPDLLAIHEEVVALVFRLGLQRRKVRTCARLGISLAPTHLALRDAGNVDALLLVGPELKQCGAEHFGAHACDRVERAGIDNGLCNRVSLDGTEASASI